MAISHLLVETTTNPTALKDFIDANKSGTFLANATVESNTENKTLTITKGSSVVSFLFVAYATSSATPVAVKINTAGGTDYGYTLQNSYKSFELMEAYLCNNGLLIKCRNRGSATRSIFTLITVDSNGDLTLMYKSEDGLADTNGYRLVSYNSNACVTVTLLPMFSCEKTSLAPVSVLTPNNAISVSNVYAATQTQLSSMGLATVTAGSDSYITNGCWYVKD